MPARKFWALSLGLLILGLALASGAQAHKLLVSAQSAGPGVLKVQAFFPDGNPAQEVSVTVVPAAGGASRTGLTDAQGLLTLTGLSPGDYRVVVGDPLGHRAETRVVLPGGAAPAAPAPAPAVSSQAPAPPGEPLPWSNILAGLGFIFGVSAFILVLKLRAEFKRHASGN
jgi:hypothetical protein